MSQTDNVAQPHAIIDEKLQLVPYRNYDNVGPAASLNTTALDLLQYVRLYLNNGQVDQQPLIDPQAFAELTRAQTVIPIETFPPPLEGLTPQFYAYGLGWFIRDYHGRKIILHSGGVDGMTAIAGFVPEEQLGIVVLSNQETPVPAAVLSTVADRFFGPPETDWFAAYQAAQNNERKKNKAAAEAFEKSRITPTTPSLPLENYAGKFCDNLYGEASLTMENGHLVLRLSQSPCFTGDLEHWHYDTFRVHWRDPMISERPDNLPTRCPGRNF